MTDMQIRRVRAGHGWLWVRRSVEMFARSPLTWTVLNLLLLSIGSVLTWIPVIGGLLFALLTPVFAGGLMLGCRDVNAGMRLQPAHLFAGFQRNAAALVSVGGVYVVGQIVVMGLLMAIGGAELQALVASAMGEQPAPAPSPTPSPTVGDRVMAAVLVAGALFVPLAMAVWFAPVLAVLDGLRASQAIKLSLQGCLRNLAAVVVYALAMGALLLGLLFAVRTLLGFVPRSLGFVREPVAMLMMTFWVSLTLISAYIGYRDIFADDLAPVS
jgi:hypothetical protein